MEDRPPSPGSTPPATSQITVPSDVAAPPSDAKTTESGLAYKVLKTGSGTIHPTIQDTVEVHYSGWTTDGKMFDSSVERGTTAKLPLSRVIPGWTEGLQLMVEGEKTRFWIPKTLAYNDQPGRPAGMLVFDVELFDIKRDIPAPEDVSSPPTSAQKTESGLTYKVLEPGKGDKPTAESRVKVHYTGWTTDGKMFDSSIIRDRPGIFGVNQVIPGWAEGVQLMQVGEKTRFWIPENLAYKGAQGAPQGMLVFDVELLEILK